MRTGPFHGRDYISEVVVAQQQLDACRRVGRQAPQLARHSAQRLRAHVLHVGHAAAAAAAQTVCRTRAKRPASL